ncbi:hypothetical protein OKW42_008380 [Paraburkholderia sp. WC7.3d]
MSGHITNYSALSHSMSDLSSFQTARARDAPEFEKLISQARNASRPLKRMIPSYP